MPTLVGGTVPDRSGWQREFDARLDHAITKAGRSPQASGPLNATESTCREAECMARLAESAEVNIVLGLRVTADRGSPPSYKLVLTRYDRDRPGVVRHEDAECSVCTELQTAERVEHMVSVVLPSLVVVPMASVAENPPVVEKRGPSRKTLLALMGVSAALGVGGIAMIGAGGKALAINGDPTTMVPLPQQALSVYDTKGTGTALVAVGAVLLVTSVIELGVEGWALRRRAR